MTIFRTSAVAAALLVLSACGGQGDDALGDEAADRAEEQAENLEARAENVEEAGEQREEAIDEADVDAGELSPAERNALVNGQ